MCRVYLTIHRVVRFLEVKFVHLAPQVPHFWAFLRFNVNSKKPWWIQSVPGYPDFVYESRVKQKRRCIIQGSRRADLLHIPSVSRVTSSLVQHAGDLTRLWVRFSNTLSSAAEFALCNSKVDEISPRRGKPSLCCEVVQPWKIS